MNPYIGHATQFSGVEEHRLMGGKGEGMRLLEVRNGKGLELTICPDRCLDISRLSVAGINCGYFASCGYVHPAYYDDCGEGFLKSFSAGFLTTCGLTNVGPGGEENGQSFPLHGTIGNTPAEHVYTYEKDGSIVIKATMNDSRIFDSKLMLYRTIICSTEKNCFTIEDEVENQGDVSAPLMLIYHMNIGYPLLTENAQVSISPADVRPRDAYAAGDLETCYQMLPPTAGFREQCYFHTLKDADSWARIENADCGIELEIVFNGKTLPCLTEWKMMGVRDYVLGLEPGLCFPTGRVQARKDDMLMYLMPGEIKKFSVAVHLRQTDRINL